MAENDLQDIIRRIRDEKTRWDAILALKLHANETWVDPLIAYLDDAEWVVRWCCAEKLGDLQNPKAIGPLIQRLADTDDHVQKNAVNALLKFGVQVIPDAVPYLKEPNMAIRKNIHKLIQEMGQDALPVLEKEITKKPWIIANNIAHAIWIVGGGQSEVTLIRLLHHAYIQKTVIVLLGQLKSSLSLPYLVQLFAKASLKRPILNTINLIGYDQAVPQIIYLLSSTKPKISGGAFETLKKIGPAAKPYLLDALKQDDAHHGRILVLLDHFGLESVKAELIELAKTYPHLSDTLSVMIKKAPSQAAPLDQPSA